MKKAAERIAINAPIQGSASDLIKKAMIDIHKFLKGSLSHLLLQVHDELVFEVPECDVKSVTSTIKEKMENAQKFIVPLKVDIAIGKSWGQ